MNKFYVYAHYKPDSLIPFYIGKGFKERAFSKHRRNLHWKNTVNKHGLRVEIMYENLSEAMAFQLEKDFIKMYGRADLGCGPLVNMTNGGDGEYGRTVSSETRRKLSEFHLGKPLSEETKAKMKIARKGRRPMLGKKHSEESKEKMSQTRIGIIPSIETRKKRSDSMKRYLSLKESS